MSFTIINYYGKQASRCGYCKGAKCSIAHGMHAFHMCPKDYQDLIDRGWRRSGHYCYKPHNSTTCCPCYTIKCDALEFKPSKSHKKVLKRMTRFLRDGKKDKNEEVDMLHVAQAGSAADDDTGGAGGGIRDEPQEPNIPIPDVNLEQIVAANLERHAVAERVNEHCDDRVDEQKSKQIKIAKDTISEPAACSNKSSDGINPIRKKAKQIRLERRQSKLESRAMNASASASEPNKGVVPEKTLAEYFAETKSTDKHKLQLKLVHVNSQQFKITQSTTYALYQKYQTRIHNDPSENEQDYLEFLQRSPLKHIKSVDGPSDGYGSFHQQYWLDDKLIAVAVIDILPSCISSVYFFYDPDYSFLSLGTYGSLREIEFVQQIAQRVPALKYYYMGFYIHSCPKMRYKGKLASSQLLCPETYTWHLLSNEIRSKLDENKYQRLNNDPNAGDADEFAESDVDNVRLLVENNTCVLYRRCIQITGDNDDREMIIEWGKLVGKPCAHRLLYLKS